MQQTLTNIKVTAANGDTTLAAGGREAFTAVATDQFGNNMAPQPTFIWTPTSDSDDSGASAGSIDKNGLYTAPDQIDSLGITVTAQATGAGGTPVSGNAQITVAADQAPHDCQPGLGNPRSAGGVGPALRAGQG